MNRQELVDQTSLAFDFIQKLYLEVSYLIKEVEGLLAEEDEKFVIGRPSGYGITTRSSTGLEATNVHLWPLRKLAVFFVPEDCTQIKGGSTNTKLDDSKVIYVRVVLDERDLAEPTVYFGVFHDLVKKTASGVYPNKFEHLMGHMEYNDTKVFRTPETIDYEDSRIKLRGRLLTANLYDIVDSEQIANTIIAPVLSMFRETG